MGRVAVIASSAAGRGSVRRRLAKSREVTCGVRPEASPRRARDSEVRDGVSRVFGAKHQQLRARINRQV